MEAFDDMLGWDADGGDEELGAAVDDDIHKFVELALSIIVAALIIVSASARVEL